MSDEPDEEVPPNMEKAEAEVRENTAEAEKEGVEDKSPSQPTITDATTVYATAQDRIEDLDPTDNPEDIVEEAGAVLDFVEELGAMVAEGLDEADARSLCGNLSDASEQTKTDLWEKVKREADKARSSSDDAPRPFDEVVEDDLVSVTILSTTDSHQKRAFRWLFAGDSYRVRVETRTSKDDKHSHYDWNHFRDDYFDARDGAEMPGPPRTERRGGEGWREFLAGIIQNRRDVEEVKGPRTITIEQLQRQIRQSKAYKEPSDALERDGLGVDSWPEKDVDEVWVPNARIKRLCDENEITVRALQSELSSKALTSPEVNGVSHTVEETTWWRLRRTIAEPAEYVEEPESAVDRMAAKKQAPATDSRSATGEIASVGPADEGAESDGGDSE